MRNNTPRAARLPLLIEGNKRLWIPAFAGMTNLLLLFTLATSAFAAPAIQTYDQLLSAIREVRAESQQRIEKAVDSEKVREAWETGKLIDEHFLQHKERADYGDKVLDRLSDDLGTSHTELSYMLRFFRAYPILPAPVKLSWSHYRELITIDDVQKRNAMTDEAVSNHWTQKQVFREIRRRHLVSSAKPEKYPAATPGKINTYRVVKGSLGSLAGKLAIDLGFSNYVQPSGMDQFKEGDWVTFVPERDVIIPSGRPQTAESEGTYTAYVTQVIDGDTFHALVDLGFHFVTEQTLRLCGLDAAEIESSDGREAKEFLEKQGIRPGAKILIKTLKSDKYDRYLVDVWTSDGKYINQSLFNEGLAVMVSE